MLPKRRLHQIGHDLGIWNFKDDLSDFLNIAQLKHRQNVQTFPERSLNNQVGKAADILNVFMHAKDFLHYQHHRKIPASIAYMREFRHPLQESSQHQPPVSGICVDGTGRSG